MRNRQLAWTGPADDILPNHNGERVNLRLLHAEMSLGRVTYVAFTTRVERGWSLSAALLHAKRTEPRFTRTAV